jgi:hypothetical protein
MAFEEFVDRVVRRLRRTRADLALLSTNAVPGSLFSGGAGVAFFLHEASRLLGDESLHEPARAWCRAAEAWAGRATIHDWKDLSRGFLVGETGLAYVGALLAAREGDAAKVLAAVERVERVSSSFDDQRPGMRPTDLVGGHGGVLCAVRDLAARLPRTPAYDPARTVLEGVRERAVGALLAASRGPLLARPGDALGVAHGVAGELWVLVDEPGCDDAVDARLSALAALRETDDEGRVYWPPSPGSDAVGMFGSWCNGMAGHTLLWCDVARRGCRPDARDLAARAAESLVVLDLPNATLCCGLAGQSIALQRYAHLSGGARFTRLSATRLRRAIHLADEEGSLPFLDLWPGVLGVALVALRRLHREWGFPCVSRPAPRTRATPPACDAAPA